MTFHAHFYHLQLLIRFIFLTYYFSGPNKLGSLFGGAGNTNGSTSLTYSAPKQPKQQTAAPAPAAAAQPQSQTVEVPPIQASALPVQLFRLYVPRGRRKRSKGIITNILLSDSTSNKYEPVGNVGIVIMGNKAARKFQILVYQSKDKRLVSVHITHDFAYTVSNSGRERREAGGKNSF